MKVLQISYSCNYRYDIWQHENFDRIIRDKDELYDEKPGQGRLCRKLYYLQMAFLYWQGIMNNWWINLT